MVSLAPAALSPTPACSLMTLVAAPLTTISTGLYDFSRTPKPQLELMWPTLDDTSLLNGLQALSSWTEFVHHPYGTTLGLYAASLFLPSIATAYLGDLLSHHLGRRIALAIGSAIVLLGGLVNTFAINTGMWAAGMGTRSGMSFKLFARKPYVGSRTTPR